MGVKPQLQFSHSREGGNLGEKGDRILKSVDVYFEKILYISKKESKGYHFNGTPAVY